MNHNFGGGKGWFRGKVNNLPPKGITSKDITLINSFENDVQGITPVNNSQIENSIFKLQNFESRIISLFYGSNGHFYYKSSSPSVLLLY